MTQDKAPEWAIDAAVELVDSETFKGLMAVGRVGKCSEMVADALMNAGHRETANLISIIADIRDKSGVGAKPMLGELADAIALALSQAYERGQESMRERADFEVRPLEWRRDYVQNEWHGNVVSGTGQGYLVKDDGRWCTGPGRLWVLDQIGDVEAAMAACFLDYDARIRSAIRSLPIEQEGGE